MTNTAIAIDGPVGVGKSTTARLVAQKLNMAHIDTGAMYRAVALFQIENGLDMHDAASLENSLEQIQISIKNDGGKQKIFLNGADVTEKIRTSEVSEGASVVAVNQGVREKLVAAQREMAAAEGVVMDGRDIGSHVLPDAGIKIYLDAPLEIRARRRLRDLESAGRPAEFDQVLNETIIRDHRDKNRKHSPLIQTPDALCIDTSRFNSPDETADEIVKIFKASR
ncbi:MAG: (d)CMP kinase [Defluviitaleaceae bacterium]|nr:(d)CMP kinase [Defluviitaleaceae bacterium]